MALDAEEVYGALFKKATGAATYAEQARTYATTAAEIFEDIKEVAETIPEDYTELSNRVSDLTKVYDFTDLASLKVGTDIFPGDRVKFRYSPQNGQTVFMWSKNDGTFGMVNAKSGGSTEKDTIIFEVTDEYKAIGPKPNSFTFFEVTSTRPVDVTEIEQSLEKKMEYFKVTATGAEDNLTIRHDGVAMTYEQLKDIYLNDKYFLYAEHYDLTMIPSLPPLDYDPILEFICTWMYQGETRISRLIINGENHAKFETVVVPSNDTVVLLLQVVSSLGNTKANASDLAYTDRKLDALWKINEGQTYDFESKAESGLNIAPSGAKFMSAMEFDGKAEQESTNGYNILTYPYYDNKTVTRNGITFTDNKDGTITVNGTASSNTFFNLVNTSNMELPQKYKKYVTISVEGASNDGVRFQFLCRKENGESVGGMGSIKVSYDFSDCITGYFRLSVSEGVTINNITVKPMVEEFTSETHTWEPYTGGQPSPSPEYPQEIQTVREINFKIRKGEEIVNVFSITPPREMCKVRDYVDRLNVEKGVYEFNTYRETLTNMAWDGTRYAAVLSKINSDFIGTNTFQPILCNKAIFKTSSVENSNSCRTGTLSISGIKKFVIYSAETNNPNPVDVLYSIDKETSPIPQSKLDLLKQIDTLSTDYTIEVTDQNGRDISYILEYIVSLKEV